MIFAAPWFVAVWAARLTFDELMPPPPPCPAHRVYDSCESLRSTRAVRHFQKKNPDKNWTETASKASADAAPSSEAVQSRRLHIFRRGRRD